MQAVTGKHSRAIRSYLNQQANRRAVEEYRGRKQGLQRKNLHLNDDTLTDERESTLEPSMKIMGKLLL